MIIAPKVKYIRSYVTFYYITTRSHDQSLKSHDQSLKSHDQSLKSHDQSFNT